MAAGANCEEAASERNIMKVGIATDHGGLKQASVAQLRGAGHEVVDFGAHKLKSEDGAKDL